MTKEEFKKAVKDMYDDILNPQGELAGIFNEMEELATEIREHDPIMASKFLEIKGSFESLKQYVVLKAGG